MSWPTMSDYQEAVQNPANCFSDAQLKAGTPALNALGLPQPVTGGFCSVYQVTSGKTRWAVRCFLHNIRDGRERYKEISKYLRGRKLKEMVGFEYVQDGIRVRGDWHPVLKMEWVDGLQLNSWVDRNAKDAKALRQLDDRWAQLMEALEGATIGHCDLQHGNVLVDGSGHLRLIDYDGMYVPALRGKGSHEKGHPAYQHPQRDGKDFDEHVDRFSALVVHTSLIAVAESPELWKRFYDDDNLIFKRADFMDPDGAPVFQELAKLKGVVADRAAVLRDACKKRLNDTPRLRDVRGGQRAQQQQQKKPARIFQMPFASRNKAQVAEATAQANASAPPVTMKKVAGGGAVPVAPSPAPRATTASTPAPRATTAPAGGAPSAASPPAKPAPKPLPALIQLPNRGAKPAPKAAPPPPPARTTTPALKVVPPPAKPAPSTKHAAKPAPPAAKHAAPTPGKPSGSQPTWMATSSSAPAPQAPAQSPSKSAPAQVTSRVSSAPAAPQRTPSAPATAAAPAPHKIVTPRSTTKLSSRRTTSGAATWTGWGVEWMRPGDAHERHIWQMPVWGTRDVPRRFLGIPLGMKREKYAESYEERTEDAGFRVGGHRALITALAFTLDARLLASASRDGTVRVWNVKRGREAVAPLEATSPVIAMAIVPDRTMIAAVLEERALVLWDHGSRRRVIHLEAPNRSALKAVAVSNDGQWVAAGGAGRRLYVWNSERGVLAGELEATTGRIEAIAFTPDASGIVCSTHKNRLELFDRTSGQARWSIRTGCGRVATLAMPPRSHGVLGGARDGTVARWNLSDGSELSRVRPLPERLTSLAASIDASHLLIGTGSGKASVHEVSGSREVGLLDGHPGAVTAAAMSAAGNTAATGTTDGTVRLWGLR